ncbi:MAG: fructose-1,6-bisphosphatase [Lachnospiraceae bacterium]|nr:fructose-1,6-bisphosphatase [Lachnospiraceae bacterium]
MKQNFTPERLRYLRLLSKDFPGVSSAGSEIIKLQTILNLPKGTEHFMSDIHGEYEAFEHILNSCSGEVKEKIHDLFAETLGSEEINNLATLIYYPSQKLAMLADAGEDTEEWFRRTIACLVRLYHFVSLKHTRREVRRRMSPEYPEVIDELLHLQGGDGARQEQYESIVDSIIRIGQAPRVILAICAGIKDLAVDYLHIVGDIFDRGPRADIVMDRLMEIPQVDIQWGNHDVLWMGAACGSRTLVATVLSNSIHYNNLDVIETGYGISLRPLAVFADEVYKDHDTHCFEVKLTGEDADRYTEKEKLQSARMYKAITIILFKLEGQKILRHPEFSMEDRLLLDKIDYEKHCVNIGGKTYSLEDWDFPTVDPKDPYTLTPEEDEVINQLRESFRHSVKIQEHVHYLYAKGSLYKVFNGNLLFHGCVPMTKEGKLMSFSMGGKERSGREFMDYADRTARKAYFDKRGSLEHRESIDFLWWLWTGKDSPLFGRNKMATFERRFIREESTWKEDKNPYYTLYEQAEICDMVLKEFGLEGSHCHIVNGHVPVKAGKGESPVKGGGKLLVIDGGLSKAYQPTSGIAGYTLMFTSRNLRIVAHQPFSGLTRVLEENDDIINDSLIFEVLEQRMRVSQCDEGIELRQRVEDLTDLLEAYMSGALAETGR